MLATLNIVSNPFHPTLDRIQKPIQRKLRVNTIVQKHKINLTKPVVCYYNGEAILRKQWGKTVIKDGDVVSFVYLPQGGGGSNPLRLILMIGLTVFAPYLAGIIAPGLVGTLAGSLLSAGIGFLGNTLINALIPPPQPPKSQQANAASAPSPTYTIGAQGNQGRIGQAIPVIYGKMKVYPDFAAQPYAEYEGNEQYLYQLFTVTQGAAEINTTDVFIEDTPIASFGSDFKIEILPPNTNSTLFPNNVYNVASVSGIELFGGTNPSTGPFPVSPSDPTGMGVTFTNKLAFDIVLPRGLAYVNDEGGNDGRSVTLVFYAKQINDSGGDVTSLFEIGRKTISGATQTAIRNTYKFDVLPARYAVSVARLEAKDTNTRTSNDVVWTSARGYSSVVKTSYGDITMMAMKIKATNTISSQSSRKVNILVTRKLEIPSFNTSTGVYNWSARTKTQSIAWAIADICRAAYGAGVTEARFDIAQLIALNAIWTARGDKLNCAFDSSQTFWDALMQVCRAGRCRPYIQGGMIHFVRDALQTLPTAMFTNRNIVKGSFKITYVMPSSDNSDAVDVTYFDEVIWQPRTVRAQLDVGQAVRPAKINAFGITNRAQAWREGIYSAASNRYRRKEISFDTELEGHIPALGDLIGVQSDIPEWGQSGEVVGVSAQAGGTTIITSSEPFVWTAGATHYAMLRRANGSANGPIVVTQGADEHSFIVYDADVDFSIYSGFDKEKTHISFGRSGQVIQLAKVLTTTPNSGKVTITAINENVLVHSADATVTIPVDLYSWALSAPKIKPILSDFTITQTGSGTTPTISLSWSPAPGASYYIIESSTDNLNWSTLGEITGSSYNFLGNIGTLYVRIAAFGGVIGPYVTNSIVVGSVAPPANVVAGTISANGQSYDVSWTPVTDCNGYRVEVYNGISLKRKFNTVSTNFAYTLENAIADGGPWRSVTVKIFALKGQVSSSVAYTLYGTNLAPTTPVLTVVPGNSNISITLSKCNELDYAGSVIHASPTSGFTPGPENIIFNGVGNFFIKLTSATLYIRAAHYDTYGNSGLNYSVEYSSTPTSASGGIRSVSSLPTPVTAAMAGDVVYLTTDDLIYTCNGTVWTAAGAPIADGSITTAKLAAGSVIASKIFVGNLAAVSADLGAIIAGSITLDNLGFIRGGQPTYDTGTGFYLGYSGVDYKFSVGSPSRGITWDGTNFGVKSPSFNLSPAGISVNTTQFTLSDTVANFSGALSAATGSFNGTLLAGVLDLQSAIGETHVYQLVNSGATIVAPAGKTSMRITLSGGAGGGAGGGYPSNDSDDGSGGGGGGGGVDNVIYTQANITAGTSYTITVGTGGIGGAGAPIGPNAQGGNGTNGALSSVKITSSGLVLAQSAGANGGASGIVAPRFLDGGIGGNGSGTTASKGGNGGPGGHTTTTTTTAALGPTIAPFGGAGGISGNGTSATKGGKGGAGGKRGGMSGAGSGGVSGLNGDNGQVIIEFFNPNSVVLQTQYSNLKAQLAAQFGYVNTGGAA